MAFFDDLFSAVTGQQTAPQQTIIPTDQLLGQSFGALNAQVAPGILGFNQALAPGLTDVQLGVTNQLDPSILGNFRGANASILNELNLGSNLGQELQDQVIRNALQGNTASGFGASAGGRGLVARDLGLTGMQVLQDRQNRALSAGTSGMGLSRQLYNPDLYSQLGLNAAAGIAQDVRGVQAARDEAVNVAENIRQQNFASLLNTGGKILGGVVGGIAGSGNPMAIQAGMNIGGSIFQGGGVAGQPRRAAAGGGGGFDLSSIMGMFGGGGGIGGPQYGIGAGQTYANSRGGVSTSVRASPVDNF